MRKSVLTALTLISALFIAEGGRAEPRRPAARSQETPQLDMDTLASVVVITSDGKQVADGIVTKGGQIITTARTAMLAASKPVITTETGKTASSVAIDPKTGFGLLQMHGVIPPMASVDMKGLPLKDDDAVVCKDDEGAHTISLGSFRRDFAEPLERGRDGDLWDGAEKEEGACAVFDAKTRELKALVVARREENALTVSMVRVIPTATALKTLLP